MNSIVNSNNAIQILESSVLSAILHNNELYYDIAPIVKPECFTDEFNKAAFLIIEELSANDIEFSSGNIIMRYSSEEGNVKAIKFQEHIRSIEVENCILDRSIIIERASLIHEVYLKRSLRDSINAILSGLKIHDPAETASAFIKKLDSKIDSIVDNRTKDDIQLLHELCASFIELSSKSGKHSTGFKAIDNKLNGGIGNGDLVIIAGRPSMGKTAFVVSMIYNMMVNARHANIKKQAVLFFSIEMTGEQIAGRFLSMFSGVSAFNAEINTIGSKEYQSVRDAINRVSAMDNIEVLIDNDSMDIHAIRSRIRSVKKRSDIELCSVFIDYLQLMQSSTLSKYENRNIEIGNITRLIKSSAKKFNIPIVVLSQLSRAPTMRKQSKPILSDLRDSGSIEQDADAVLIVNREYETLRKDEPKRESPNDTTWEERYHAWRQECDSSRSSAVIDIAKNRNGPTGEIELMFEYKIMRFKDMDN